MWNYITSQSKKVLHHYNKLSTWAQILIVTMCLIMVTTIFKKSYRMEGFIQSDQFVIKQGTKMYDQFYANIYDDLVYNDVKDHYEVGQIVNKTTPTSQSVILDIGCGTGHHVNEFNKLKLKAIGIDISPDMINKSKENYPHCEFKQEDILNTTAFQPSQFTHITCFYFTIYYMNDKRLFFQNCMNFLKPGGYLIIHLVNRNKFDPILPPGNPLIAISPQRYAKERITNTKIKFNDFSYDANFELDESKNIATFTEKIKSLADDKKTRKNEHTFYMESQEAILNQAKDAGFLLDSKIDLINVSYEYQYLYILTKPN